MKNFYSNIVMQLNAAPDVSGGLDSMKNEINPIVKALLMFLGWGGGVICFFVLVGLIIAVGIKRSNHEVVDKKSISAIGIVLIVMVVLGAVGTWSTFFLK